MMIKDPGGTDIIGSSISSTASTRLRPSLPFRPAQYHSRTTFPIGRFSSLTVVLRAAAAENDAQDGEEEETTTRAIDKKEESELDDRTLEEMEQERPSEWMIMKQVATCVWVFFGVVHFDSAYHSCCRPCPPPPFFVPFYCCTTTPAVGHQHLHLRPGRTDRLLFEHERRARSGMVGKLHGHKGNGVL